MEVLLLFLEPARACALSGFRRRNLDSILHSQVVRSTLSSSMRQLHQFFVINSGPMLWSKLFASNFVQRLFYWNSSRDVLWTSFEVNWCSGLALPRARASTNKLGVTFFVVRDCQIPRSVWPLLANNGFQRGQSGPINSTVP